ncbi:MAG: PAS domain S-box-containing protein [Myxococcota bacterium]|jgi:PAS domain S-box-containing protein
MSKINPTGVEVSFEENDMLVSKTDARGIILYANREFTGLSGYDESELLGRPHSIVRHPEMPRAVFHLLWEEVQAGREIFAYILNLTKTGDHYWVLAHVTPDIESRTGQIIGYHSNRRKPNPQALVEIQSLYAKLLDTERRHTSARDACLAGRKRLAEFLAQEEFTYEQYVFHLFATAAQHAA